MRYLILFSLITNVSLAERPTKEELKETVEKSIEQYREDNPPPTQQEVMDQIEKKAKSLNDAPPPKFKTPREERDYKLNKAREIRKLKEEWSQVKRKYVPEPTPPRLAKMNWGSLPVGAVGHLGKERRGRTLDGYIRCLQILGKDKILAQYQYAYFLQPRYGPRGVQLALTAMDGREFISTPFVLVGVDSDALVEGKLIKDFDESVVVTSKYTYETVGAGVKTVPVLEIFDFNKLDEWK
ncbi:hypothetical protein OAF98_05410 [Planctomicrobium sp.]|nr:hypothetical protein [Planctomicrobium sp.]MDB4743905.1 hypothetical protein [Planctomicrobium sp.]